MVKTPMKIQKKAQAGSLESSDVLITVAPSDKLTIEITSIVMNQFGEIIREVVQDVLNEAEITCGEIIINDRGALEYALRARLKTVLKRANGGEE